MIEREFINPAIAAEKIGRSRNHIYIMIRTGKLKAYKLGERGYLIKPADLEAALVAASGEAKW
jgi:excisionase family DNA binding protein